MSTPSKVNINVSQLSASASKASARDHHIIMDRPPEKGGENKGPLGGETFLMAFGGCFMSNLLAAGQARETPLSDVRLDISGTIDDTPARFVAIELTVSAPRTDPQTLEKLMTIAERGCLVANTLKQALDLTIIAA